MIPLRHSFMEYNDHQNVSKHHVARHLQHHVYSFIQTVIKLVMLIVDDLPPAVYHGKSVDCEDLYQNISEQALSIVDQLFFRLKSR